jgi:hypothetical protein
MSTAQTNTTRDHAPASEAEQLALEWVAEGHVVTLQGTVVHTRASRTVALYCVCSAGLSLLALQWPYIALIGLLAVGLSALVDLEGGQGWLRPLVPREPDFNVIAWPSKAEGPLLLVAAVLDSQVRFRHLPSWLLQIPLGLTGIAVIGCLLSTAAPEVAQPTLVTATLCLTLIGVVALAWRFLTRPDLIRNPARTALELAMAQVDRHSPTHLNCAFALIGGGLTHHDGLQTLLLNHHHRLSPDRTRILVIHPDQHSLGAVHHEGRIRRHRSDGLLVSTMRGLGLPGRTRSTAAARAQRLGWRAAALTVSPEQTHAAAGVIAKIVQHIDQAIATKASTAEEQTP